MRFTSRFSRRSASRSTSRSTYSSASRTPRPAGPSVRRITTSFTSLTASVAVLALTGGLLAGIGPVRTPGSADAQTAPALSLVSRNTNPVTPGNFTGYGFDQCLAPKQKAMNRWLNHSPFLAVGIYISGDSRACRSQPNLTPKWISTQLSKGWRLLPIALGPQASCQPRFPRYADDFTINPKPGPKGKWGAARKQGVAEAKKNSADATALGLTKGSTIWYDLEGFDHGKKNCRESALAFVSGWVGEIERLGYVSGLYSSASSGIVMVDDARRNRPGQFNLPKQIWIARWDGMANTSTTYIGEAGWRPGGRVKQYIGDHNETHGGVTINIDSNYLDLGTSAPTTDTRCSPGPRVAFTNYPTLRPDGTKPGLVRAMKCLMIEQGAWSGNRHKKYGKVVQNSVKTWQSANGFRPTANVGRKQWMKLLSTGARPTLKIGSTGPAVHRLQQALTAAGVRTGTLSSGVFDQATHDQVRTYKRNVKLKRDHGVVNPATWRKLHAGAF